MFVRCAVIAEGPGPSEAIVSLLTVEGHQEEVVLSKRSIKNDAIDVGSPLLREETRYLIELPRESASGRWRIWIPESEIAEEKTLQPA